MKVLGIVPARGGSKRLPRKNVRRLGGKPLVAWAIEASLGAKRLARVVVSSDDEEVLAIAAGYDPRLVLRRPAEISHDTALAITFVQHALATLEAAGEGPYEAIAIIQPSSPLTISADIDATIELLEKSGADSAVTVMALDHAIHPLKLKRMEGDRLLAYLEEERGRMAAHQLPPLFVRNCAVYASRRRVVDGGQILGEDCRGHVMPRERSLDINEEIDLAFVEFLLARNKTNRSMAS
jgi:CMP-N-acetylneuraminic acid synthetase